MPNPKPVTHIVNICRNPGTQAIEFQHFTSTPGVTTPPQPFLLETLNEFAPLVVAPGDFVTWTCDLGHFAVLFEDESPFKSGAVSLGAGHKKYTPSWSARPKKKSGAGGVALPGENDYKYYILILERTSSGIVPIHIDPIMEIEDGSGGGGGPEQNAKAA